VLEVDDPAVQREKLMAQMKNEPSPLRVLAQDDHQLDFVCPSQAAGSTGPALNSHRLADLPSEPR
jgi:hypothetical protein